MSNAIDKIQSEMDANKNNSYVQVVGGFLLQHIADNPQDIEKIADKDKTIIKSLDAMKKAAEKKKVGSCAVLTDQEGFQIVLNYFGITGGTKAANPNTVHPIVKHDKPAVEFDVRLEDLL